MAGCSTLSALLSADPSAPELPEAKGAIKAVAEALSAHGTLAPMHEIALEAFARLCQGKASATAAGDVGAIALVLESMAKFKGSDGVAEMACFALGRIAAPSAELKSKAMAAGSLSAVLTAMRDHPSAAGVLARGCGALSSFAFGDGLDSVVAREGGIEAIVKAMAAVPGDAALQEAGCDALASIARLNESEAAVAAAGGVGSFLIGCGDVTAVAQLDGNEDKVASAGGIKACLSAMKAHPKERGVQAAALAALCSMTAVFSSNKAKAAEAGGIAAASDALRAFADDAAIQERGCRLLAHIAGNGDFRRVVRDAGAEALADATIMKLRADTDAGRAAGRLRESVQKTGVTGLVKKALAAVQEMMGSSPPASSAATPTTAAAPATAAAAGA